MYDLKRSKHDSGRTSKNTSKSHPFSARGVGFTQAIAQCRIAINSYGSGYLGAGRQRRDWYDDFDPYTSADSDSAEKDLAERTLKLNTRLDLLQDDLERQGLTKNLPWLTSRSDVTIPSTAFKIISDINQSLMMVTTKPDARLSPSQLSLDAVFETVLCQLTDDMRKKGVIVTEPEPEPAPKPEPVPPVPHGNLHYEGDTYRDWYRDWYRDRYRDKYRDKYRDEYEDDNQATRYPETSTPAAAILPAEAVPAESQAAEHSYAVEKLGAAHSETDLSQRPGRSSSGHGYTCDDEIITELSFRTKAPDGTQEFEGNITARGSGKGVAEFYNNSFLGAMLLPGRTADAATNRADRLDGSRVVEELKE
ncbi:hypothetical protein QBC47DRAFT_404713 [Echria macrotheca]|uniref:Uncharacterized protein n=1 Tax=Echria macrotheca TaxID=438768 RepID=A0AAJ0F2I2_9PEZI|nr:hypothetical protein QBC47DRAFT_404713 [Echria macrotheca]